MASSSATHHLTADDAKLQQAAGEALRAAGTPEDGFAVLGEDDCLVKEWGMRLQDSWPCGYVKCPVRGSHNAIGMTYIED